LLCGAGGGQRLPDVGGDGHGDTAASGDALGYLPQADIPAGVDDDGAARQALVCGADADRGGVDPLSRGLRDHRPGFTEFARVPARFLQCGGGVFFRVADTFGRTAA
ncbi:TPA: hypothetical protein ACH7HB_004482, partial [Escherichia coli]